MSGRYFTVILFLAIGLILLAGGFFLYLMLFGGREEINVCNRSGEERTFALELQSASTSLPVLEGKLANGDCLDATLRVGLKMQFHMTVDGVQQNFGEVISQPFTIRHRITILSPDEIAYERID